MTNTAYMTVEAVAAYFDVSDSLIYKWISSGKLSPVLKVGKKFIRIPIKTLRKFEEELCPSTENDSGSGEEKMASGTSSLGLANTRDPYQLGQHFAQTQKFSAPS